MAASELNNRLDYLISYSSQLVFVCSDKIQQQSQVIDSFLAQQNEQADLALLTANELTPLVAYREKLFRQLISKTQEADFNRPLNQLLAPLNNHSGSILINIFQAERLPNKLVKELWDLVLQSRFANNKHHINVLLMGLSDWAEAAKSGLGAKSKYQPIVLNSQIEVESAAIPEAHEFSDLESYIQDKRKKFAQRIEDRQEQAKTPQSIYKKGWVATLFGFIFVAIFSGMLSWQYPEKVSALIPYFDNKLPTTEQIPQSSNEEKLLASPLAVNEATQSIEQLDTPINVPAETQIAKKTNTKDILITDWQTASAKLTKQTIDTPLQINQAVQPTSVEKVIPLEAKPSVTVKVSAIPTNTVNDYQVEDITEISPVIEQSDIHLSNIEQPQGNDSIKVEPDVLLALPEENFVIQIAAMANIGILRDYVKDEHLGEQLWLYKTHRYGADWYVLLKNQDYTTIEGARAEIFNLEDTILKNTPFVKSIAQVKQEISVSKT